MENPNKIKIAPETACSNNKKKVFCLSGHIHKDFRDFLLDDTSDDGNGRAVGIQKHTLAGRETFTEPNNGYLEY